MDPSLTQGNRGGCFSAVTRCFWGRPKEDLTRYRAAERDTIEFEDLVTAENRANAAHAKKQMVTDAERELIRTGKFDQLVEQQRKVDAERDAELRRQEEQLRQEEEAYYSAKREAARRTTQLSTTTVQVTLEEERQPHSQPDVVIHHQPRATTAPHTTSLPHLPPVSQLLLGSSQDEEDFDQFLESVKARQLTITTTTGSGNDGRTAESGGGEEEEEEVDFGYWEKAELPPEPPSDSDPTATTAAAALPAAPLPPHEESEKSVPSPVPQLKEMDLSLL